MEAGWTPQWEGLSKAEPEEKTGGSAGLQEQEEPAGCSCEEEVRGGLDASQVWMKWVSLKVDPGGSVGLWRCGA